MKIGVHHTHADLMHAIAHAREHGVATRQHHVAILCALSKCVCVCLCVLCGCCSRACVRAQLAAPCAAWWWRDYLHMHVCVGSKQEKEKNDDTHAQLG